MYRNVIVLLAGLFLALASANADVQRGPYSVIDKFNLSYGPFPKNALDACLPVAKPGQWAGPYPAMVFVHGGAWGGGDKRYHSVDCNVWASFGFAAFTINYRLLSSKDRSTWWPTQIIDAQAAIRWVRANAAALGVAASNIYALGDSAGGQLAEYLAYEPNLVPGDLAGLYPGVNSHVQLVVAEFAPSHWGPSLMAPGAPDCRTYELVTPANRSTASTLFVQGSQDTIVAPSNSVDLYDRLRSYGRPAKYLAFAGQHEFVGMAPKQRETIIAQEIAFAMNQAKYFRVMPAEAQGPVLP